MKRVMPNLERKTQRPLSLLMGIVLLSFAIKVPSQHEKIKSTFRLYKYTATQYELVYKKHTVVSEHINYMIAVSLPLEKALQASFGRFFNKCMPPSENRFGLDSKNELAINDKIT